MSDKNSKFKTLKDSADNESSQGRIFDMDFPVQQMSNPKKYLPQYQQERNWDPSLNEQCLSCCGQICKICAIPWGCCCCQNCCSCVYTLPTSSAGLVQSFGRFNRLLKPGFNLINPCSQEVREVSLKARIANVGRHTTITKDNVKLTIDASIAFRPTNPIIAHYILGANMNRALIELTTSSLREVIGQCTLDYVLSSRLDIVKRSRQIIMKGIPPGLFVENVFLEQLIIPVEIQRDLTATARQKRISQANIINSKADVQTAALMKQSAQLLDTKAAMQIRYLEMVSQLGKNGVVVIMGIGANKKGYKD